MIDDPKRPWKAILAAVAAGGAALLGFSEVLPLWAIIVVSVVLAGIATYQVPNPKI